MKTVLARPRRSARPGVEAMEGRVAPSGLASLSSSQAPVHAAQVVAQRPNPLAAYRVFEGTVQRGPDAGLTLKGPLVLGYSGRIQVIGYLFADSGARYTVVGTVYGGSVALRIVIPGRQHTSAIEAVGSGQLRRVAGGLPDGLTLVGSGNANGPDFKRDFGHWLTVPPGG